MKLNVNKKITGFYTIMKQIDNYIATIMDIDDLVKRVNDVIAGVMGIAISLIVLDKDNERKCIVNHGKEELKSYFTLHNYYTIKEMLKNDLVICINDLEENDFLNLNKKGSLLISSIKRANIDYEFILLYHNMPHFFEYDMIEFFDLITTKLAICFENVFLFNKVKEMSIKDSLTGLYNKHYLNQRLEDYVKTDEMSCIMIDIDNFKSINDTYGHSFGDYVLKTFGKLIIQTGYDEVFRYGGEEFLIILKDKNINQAYKIAEKLRNNFNSICFTTVNGIKKFTISLGVSSFKESTNLKDLSYLIDIADKALYQSKYFGKNKITLNTFLNRLYYNSFNIIERELAKAIRYKRNINIYYLEFNLKTYSKDIYKELYKYIKNSLRKSDIVISVENKYVLILEGEDKIDLIIERMKDNLKDSSIPLDKIVLKDKYIFNSEAKADFNNKAYLKLFDNCSQQKKK